MDVSATSSLFLVLLGLGAGGIGALVGIGGGIIVVPVLVIGFGYDVRTAVAASLVAVVATSAAGGLAYGRDGLTNLRLGLTLEIATTTGGLIGGLVAVSVAPSVISALFATVMLVVAVLMWRHSDAGSAQRTAPSWKNPDDGRSAILSGGYFDRASEEAIVYRPRRIRAGLMASSVAGALSGLLGVGGGFLKVPVLTMAMGVPTKAAAATSNFMVGLTAVASLAIYLGRGFVQPEVVVPLTIGIVAGALGSGRMAGRVTGTRVQRVLSLVLVLVAAQMAWQAIGGGQSA